MLTELGCAWWLREGLDPCVASLMSSALCLAVLRRIGKQLVQKRRGKLELRGAWKQSVFVCYLKLRVTHLTYKQESLISHWAADDRRARSLPTG